MFNDHFLQCWSAFSFLLPYTVGELMLNLPYDVLLLTLLFLTTVTNKYVYPWTGCVFIQQLTLLFWRCATTVFIHSLVCLCVCYYESLWGLGRTQCWNHLKVCVCVASQCWGNETGHLTQKDQLINRSMNILLKSTCVCIVIFGKLPSSWNPLFLPEWLLVEVVGCCRGHWRQTALWPSPLLPIHHCYLSLVNLW